MPSKSSIITIYIIAIITTLAMRKFNSDSICLADTIQMLLLCTTIAGLAFAIKQLEINNKWNVKNAAMENAKEARASIRNDIPVLNGSLHLLHRKVSDIIPLDEIHEAMCVVVKKDAKNLREKYEYVNDDDLKIDEEKKGVRDSIFNYLNNYEFLACGVIQGVFDADIIRDLNRTNFIKTYNNFSEYITHYNEKHRKNKNQTVWENLVELAKKYISEENEPKSKKWEKPFK